MLLLSLLGSGEAQAAAAARARRGRRHPEARTLRSLAGRASSGKAPSPDAPAIKKSCPLARRRCLAAATACS
eukprot:15483860-Alexandrium_andersonii.AAC.1